MPKILINEKDFTSPGTPSDYSNFAVLITGLEAALPAKKDARKAAKDSNGVYEFTSAGDFKELVGLVSPKVEFENTSGSSNKVMYHYGNQMAYELLNLGYPIIYKPITADQITDVAKESFWEIFKDKASYDFRFITHGLLESTEIDFTEDATYTNYKTRQTAVDNAINALAAIAEQYPLPEGTNPDTEEELRDQAYEALTAEKDENDNVKYSGLIPTGSTEPYADFETAYTETKKEAEKLVTDIKAREDALSVGVVTTGTINNANNQIANLAAYASDVANTGRGDCVALIELDESTYVDEESSVRPEVKIIEAIGAVPVTGDTGKYCAMTVPSVYYTLTYAQDETTQKYDFDNNKKFPGAFHYLACFYNSISQGFREWYAAAGYTRGVSSYKIDHTSVKLGEIAINALEPRYIKSQATDPKFACNVIANFRGSYYLWGNRTAHLLKEEAGGGDLTADNFLNIRQLCTTIKKQLYAACRRFTFDPNSDTLWFNFVGAIRPTLEVMKADQGIKDYKILKVVEQNPKKATLKAKIRIIPIEAIEDFDIEISLEDSFDGTVTNG